MNDILNKTSWKVFEISEIFEVVNSKPYHTSDVKKYDRGIPYVTRTGLNNGYESIIQNEEFVTNPSNVISFGAESAEFFYQENEYITGNKMYYITHERLNKEIGIFLVQALQSSIKDSGFGYGKGLTGTRLLKRKIVLPVDEDGIPHWQFMEDYIKQERKKQVDKVVEYYESRSEELKIAIRELSENSNFEVFRFDSIFNSIQRGKRLKKGDHIDGKIPYVSSTGLNNGLDGFIGNETDVRMFNDNLSIANSGSVGKSFYHPYRYIGSDHITSLTIEKGNKYSYLYISTITSKLEVKYSFNREINNARMIKEKIVLPVIQPQHIDYSYMENKMKNIELDILKDIIDYYK
ncbi:restriction endonuclease subunit S [Erysipelothrix anatis]|uniref:restriction endonuclease subunit S n=1 Tax=Erysipelothrix anatis TaxID=2683713 RepID=UPI00135CBE94|nr:restriction endonuclease subunit S [Erysipelothrix anatis]